MTVKGEMMHSSVLKILGMVLFVAGTLLSVLFWIPRLVNRKRLREILGPRYPLVFIIYLANGPGIALLGLLLILYF